MTAATANLGAPRRAAAREFLAAVQTMMVKELRSRMRGRRAFIVLMYGGASVDDIVRQQVVLLATALMLGAIGLFYSALLKRTQAATVLTYITVLALALGTTMVFIFWTIVANQTPDGGFRPGVTQRAPEQILYVNPGVAMLDVVGNTEPGGFGGINELLFQIRGEAVQPVGRNVECFGNVCQEFDQFGNPINAVDAGRSGYWWPRISITYVVLAGLLTVASMRLVVPAGMRFAFGRRRLATGAPIAPPPAAEPLPEGAPSIEELDAHQEREP